MSPLQEVRQALGLSLRDMAMALGLDYVTWYRAELHSNSVPRKAREALRELGFDPEEVSRRQGAWVEDRARRLRQELRGRVNIASGEAVV